MTIRNRILAALLMTVTMGHLSSGAVPADAGPAQALASSEYAFISTEFVLVNATSDWLYLYIDGTRSVSVPPGDHGVDYVSVGYHTFRAETYDGRSVTHSGYVDENGVEWTVTEE